MENTSCLSASSKSTCHSLHIPLSFDLSLPPKPQPSCIEHHIDNLEIKTGLLSFKPPPQVLSSFEESTPKKPILAASKKMRKLYPASKYCSSLWSSELRFAMRAADRASHPCLTIQDMIEGKDVFRAGLSQLPKQLFRKVYIAKHMLRDCILGHLSSSLHEVDALEKMKDIILEMHKQDENNLVAISKDLEIFKAEALACGNSINDDITYHHAVYADEFTALTSTNMQLNIMSNLSDPELTSNESESVMFDEVVEE